MNITRAMSILVLAALVLIGSPGCHRVNATTDDHLEHHDPPHKPRNLAMAVDQIERRFEAIAHGPGICNSESAAPLKELVDIVRWLPEIAGDSDLPEEQWNTVDQISEKLSPLLQEQLNNALRGASASMQPLHDSVVADVKRLREITHELPTAVGTNSNQQDHAND
jgi:hypothetical protein